MPLTSLSALTLYAAAIMSSSTCQGDVNGDEQVTSLDLMHVAIELGTNNSNYDVNNDGIVNVFDLLTVVSELGNNCNISPLRPTRS